MTARAAWAIAALILAMASTGCRVPVPTLEPGTAPPPAILAAEMAEEFQFHPARTKEKYGEHWYTVTAGPIAKLRRNTAYVSHRDDYITLSFASSEDTWTIARNETITAVCYLRIRDLLDQMYFQSCRWPEGTEPGSRPPEATAPKAPSQQAAN